MRTRTRAPISPIPKASEPADLLTGPAAEDIGGRRIQSAKELDNTEFDPIFGPKPKYPLVAMEAGIEGWVDVDMLVDENGRVRRFYIMDINGHPSFAKATSKALYKWRFPPPRLNGRSLRVRYYYRINFKLE